MARLTVTTNQGVKTIQTGPETQNRTAATAEVETAETSDETLEAVRLKTLIEKSLDDHKADDVVTIDLAGKTTFADFMVIASGQSSRQVSAMANHLLETLKANGVRDVRVEGLTHADWVLIDAGDVIVHIFRPEVRAFYSIEKMWGSDSPANEVTSAMA